MITQSAFRAWPKTGRLRRSFVITEKIDGTTAGVLISSADGTYAEPPLTTVRMGSRNYGLWAQSRNRLVYPDTPGAVRDHFGFAQWALDNAEELVIALGPGRHYGEWWGKGIQRGYGLSRRVFSLFNIESLSYRYNSYGEPWCGGDLRVVPLLLAGESFSSDAVDAAMADLCQYGSMAAPGARAMGIDPEGIVVHWPSSDTRFKVMYADDEYAKGQVEGGAVF